MYYHYNMYKLYYKPSCPYCKRVLEAIANKGISLELCDIHNEAHANFLIEIGGKRQVPFLYSQEEGVAMYESDAIIKYLGGDEDTPLPDGAACPIR